METVPTACKDLMGVRLMPYIPYQFILRRIEDIMQRYGQLNRTQGRSQMPGVLTQRLNDELAQLRAYFRQLFHSQLLQIRRRINLIDVLIVHVFLYAFACAHTRAN